MNRMICSLAVLVLATQLCGQDTEEAERLTLSSGLTLYQPSEDVSAKELDVYSAYEEAQQLETEIVQMFREIRASELTMVQRQTLKRSLESVLMPLSERAQVDRDLLMGGAESAEAVKRYQEELSVVMQETDAIVSNAQDLLETLLEKEAPEASQRSEEKEKEETETTEAKEVQEEQVTQKEQVNREKENREAREKKEKEAEEAIKKTEIHLEKAMEEIKAAREEVAKEKAAAEVKVKEETKEAEEEQLTREEKESDKAKEANEAAASREELKELEELEKKIDIAEEKVGAVIEKVKAMEDVSKVELEAAENAMKALREALGSVESADAIAAKAKTESAKQKTAEALRQMKAASLSMESALNAIKSLKDESPNGGGSAGSAVAQIQALDESAQAGSGKWIDLTLQMRNRDLAVTPDETPVEQRPELWGSIEDLERAPTARKFSADTPRDIWIFISDWYVLGRYNNEGRSNIEKVFPPESIVDLNAQYVSEDGETLRWEYESYLPPMVAPYAWESWKIYYFYTELYFEEEAEVWLAIGSDDRSDLWINDLPVWHSANRHKGWYPAEGFRKVVFKEGRNKILLRLENGQSSLGFSLYLYFKSGSAY